MRLNTNMCVFSVVSYHLSDELHTCHCGIFLCSGQAVHQMKVKLKHQLLFINIEPFNAVSAGQRKSLSQHFVR